MTQKEKKPNILREARSAYYGLITQIDYNIGLVLAALRETSPTDSLDETLIVFLSDHGEYLGDHGNMAKSFWHEVSSHIPCILKVPFSWEKELYGLKSQHLVTFSDLMPTFLKAAGNENIDFTDGIELTGLTRGNVPPREYLEGISGESPENPRASIAITDGRWKYLWFPEGGSEQLFDLANDRYETRNLAESGQAPAELERLRDELIRRHSERDTDFVENRKLVSVPRADDRRNGRRKIFRFIPGCSSPAPASANFSCRREKDTNH